MYTVSFLLPPGEIIFTYCKYTFIMWYKYFQNQINIPIPKYMDNILGDIQSVGGRALIIGGAVRDFLINPNSKPKDIDFEVYKVNYDTLSQILSKYGKADLVGASFGVIKFVGPDGQDFDFSLPRTDSKSGVGHKDFDVSVSSDLTPAEAARRRDFTVNSISYDPLTGEIIDPYNGREDLKNKILRHTSDAFAEDPLRVLRGAGFASRYGFDVAPETAELARSIKDQYQHLPKERVEGEFKKLVQKGVEPGRAIQYLYDTGWSENFPEIHNLQNVEQEKEWHPEIWLDDHTKQVANFAAKIADREGMSPEEKEVLIYSAISHDFAKPKTTAVINKKGIDRITSHGHEIQGGPMAREFLQNIGVNKRIIDQVVPLVENHLNHIHHSNSKNQEAFVKQLAERLHPATVKQLIHLIEADHSGRHPLPPGLPTQAQLMAEQAKQHNAYEGKVPDLLQGRDVMEYLGGKGGPNVGQILKEHRGMLLNHHQEMSDRQSALKWLHGRMQRESGLINGNDVIATLGLKGPEIKNMLDMAWTAQRQGAFHDKAGALAWLGGQNK